MIQIYNKILLNVIGKGVSGTNREREIEWERWTTIKTTHKKEMIIIIIIHGQLIGILMMKIQASTWSIGIIFHRENWMNIVVIQSQYTKKLSRKLKHNIYHVMNNGLFVPRVWVKESNFLWISKYKEKKTNNICCALYSSRQINNDFYVNECFTLLLSIIIALLLFFCWV